MKTALDIAIIGAGVGGLTTAISLLKAGHNVTVFEQASRFRRIGADINLTPNAVRALDGLGVVEQLLETAARPRYRISRTWDTGAETSRLEMADAAEKAYGAPQLTIHRGDLLNALKDRLVGDIIQLAKRADAIRQDDHCVSVEFSGGESGGFDLVIGADGIHSVVRRTLFGADQPEFTGVVSYRSVVPTAELDIANLDCFTKWWGPEPSSQIVTFPLLRGEETFVFATTPQDNWLKESWTAPGDVEELRATYRKFHPEARALLAACKEVTKSALYVRDPMPEWSSGRVTLLGDACHPMMPFMAQGAGQAIEDAVVLSRVLTGIPKDDVPQALRRYAAVRKDRTAKIQISSRGNEWLKQAGNADWVYGYDAWNVPL